MKPTVVSREEWINARKELLAKEKAFDKQRDALSAERQSLPWVKVEEDYVFETTNGPQSLAALFGDKSQLVVQHFMFGPDWEAGCPHCSFWVDGFDPMRMHLEERDVAFVLASRAPLSSLESYRQRMGWEVNWVSSLENTFNYDYGVSATEEQLEQGEMVYNYKPSPIPMGPESPGISVFAKNDAGEVFHTYSTYARGLDRFNAAYQVLDMVPKGRNESDLPYPQAWVKRHDEYGS